MIVVGTLIFGFAWWLGLYLISRNPRRVLLRRAGLGLIAYAGALAAGLLGSATPASALSNDLVRIQSVLTLLPPLFWSGALLRLLPDDMPLRTRLDRAWTYGLVPAIGLALVLTVVLDPLFGEMGNGVRRSPAYLILAALVVLPLLGSLLLVARSQWRQRSKGAIGLVVAATMFFSLGVGLLAVPFAWLPRAWNLLAIGLDLLLFGFAVALLDAFDEGEALRPHMVRSFIASACIALLFACQVAVAMILGDGSTFALRVLLLTTTAGAILIQVLADPLQGLLDRLVFAQSPRLQRARAELRESASMLPRMDSDLDLVAVDEAEFARLTRRALSYYGDLARLSTNPLTRLPVIDARLGGRRTIVQPLERAAELQAVLAESIARLKPRNAGDFGTTDAWRYYNALYFPYIVGVKPYRRQTSVDGLDHIAQQAHDWFGTMVPERTLHNWQNTAAKLVAQDLRATIHNHTPAYEGQSPEKRLSTAKRS